MSALAWAAQRRKSAFFINNFYFVPFLVDKLASIRVIEEAMVAPELSSVQIDWREAL